MTARKKGTLNGSSPWGSCRNWIRVAFEVREQVAKSWLTVWKKSEQQSWQVSPPPLFDTHSFCRKNKRNVMYRKRYQSHMWSAGIFVLVNSPCNLPFEENADKRILPGHLRCNMGHHLRIFMSHFKCTLFMHHLKPNEAPKHNKPMLNFCSHFDDIKKCSSPQGWDKSRILIWKLLICNQFRAKKFAIFTSNPPSWMPW